MNKIIKLTHKKQSITENRGGKTAFFETKLEAIAGLEEYLLCDELNRDGNVFWMAHGGGRGMLRHNQHSQEDFTLKKRHGKYYWTCDSCEYGVKTYKLCKEDSSQ